MVYSATTFVKEDFAYKPQIMSYGGRKFGFRRIFDVVLAAPSVFFESDWVADRLSLRAPRGSSTPVLPPHAAVGRSEQTERRACCLPLHSLAAPPFLLFFFLRLEQLLNRAALPPWNPSPQLCLHLSPPTNNTTKASLCSRPSCTFPRLH